MQIEFNCGCGTRMRTTTQNLGKKAKCPKCGSLVDIPNEIPSDSPVRASGVASPVARPTQPTPTRTTQARPPQARPAQATASQNRPAPETKRPRVVAKPIEPAPSAAPAFDPLDFSNFPMPSAGNASPNDNWSSAGWNNSPYASSKGTSNSTAILWAVGGVVGFLLLGTVGFFTYSLMSKSSSATVANNSSTTSSKSATGDSAANSASTAAGANTSSMDSSSIWPKPNPPISEAEANTVGNRFADAVRTLDRRTCEQMFQFDQTLDAITREVKMSPKDRDDFKRGFNAQPKMWDQIHTAILGDQGEYVMLRSLARDGQFRPIIRFSSEQAGLNYHELVLGRDAGGSPIILDIYNMSTGETIGETTQRIVLTMVATRDSTLMGRLTGANRQLAEYGKSLQKISNLSRSNPRAALDEISRLPPDLQREKTMMLAKLRMTSQLDQNLYISAFESFQQLFPSDPSLNLHAIDYYTARKENGKVIESLEKLKAHVGGDPYLDKLIAAVRSM